MEIDSIYNDISDLAINFGYDASQNRLSKRVITAASSDTVTNYYIRDAQGNIMAIYELKEDTVRWIEQDVYGSSRLGVLNPDSVVYPGTAYSQYFHHLQGKKQYELTNHLGNVLTTINDRKIGVDTATTDGHYDYWLAAQISGQDYYSGGMVMPERSFAFDFYRFGAASGQEKDNDISGIGNSYTAEYWHYDSRLNRRWNIDPAFAQKPWMSSYHSFSNKFISNIDPNGANDGHWITSTGTSIGDDGRDDNNLYTVESSTYGSGTIPKDASSLRTEYDKGAENLVNKATGVTQGSPSQTEYSISPTFKQNSLSFTQPSNSKSIVKDEYFDIKGVEFSALYTFGASASLDLGGAAIGGGIEVDLLGIRDWRGVGFGVSENGDKVVRSWKNLDTGFGLLGGGVYQETVTITHSNNVKEQIKATDISLCGITYSRSSINLTTGVQKSKMGVGIGLKEGGILLGEFDIFIPFFTRTVTPNK